MRFRSGSRGSIGYCKRLPNVIKVDAGTSLPIVERIDPALVPEVFWLDVSSRLPASNPRMRTAGATAPLIERLAWYDRDVAAALFEPARARIEQAGGDQPASLAMEFLAWSAIDPRRRRRPAREVAHRSQAGEHSLSVHGLSWRNRSRKTTNSGGGESGEDWDMILGGTKRGF